MPEIALQPQNHTLSGWRSLAPTRATGSISLVPFSLALKAQALQLADRTSNALQAIREAEAIVEITGGRFMSSELHPLRGVFLAAIGVDDTKIEASFCEAIRIAKEPFGTPSGVPNRPDLSLPSASCDSISACSL